MESELTTLLVSWGMPQEVIQKFEEESVDTEALQNLLLDDLKLLIPSIGLRTKFRVNWSNWKDREIEKIHQTLTPDVTTTDISSTIQNNNNNIPGSKSSSNDLSIPSVSSKSNDTQACCNALYQLMNRNVHMKTLLTNKHFTKTERSSLARFIISHLIETTPGTVLKPALIDQWAQYIVELFPEEDKKLYFFSVGANFLSPSRQSFGSRQLPSKGRRYYGCLWDNWNNVRKKLRVKQIIPYVKRQAMPSTSSESTISIPEENFTGRESCLKIVKEFQEEDITEYLRDAWQKSNKERLAVLAKQNTVEDYLTQFPVLKNQQIAIELIHLDYAASSPLIDPSVALVEELQKYKQAIIDAARNKYVKLRDKINKNILEKIFDIVDSGDDQVGALLLLPYLFSTGGKVNKGQRASRAEAAGSFVLLCDSLTEGEALLQQRRQNKKTSVQPLILAIGKGWGDVTSAYVFVDKPLYRFSNILDASQMCFKIFFAFDLHYPLECEHIWLLIQRGFFKICLPTDKIILGVSQVMEDLKMHSAI